MPIDNSELRTYANQLRLSTRNAERKASQVVRKTALDIARDAKAIAHQKFSDQATGATANSIAPAFPGPLDAEIGPTTYYATFVEHGTSRMAAKPFMGPAADRHEGPFAEALATIAGEAMS